MTSSRAIDAIRSSLQENSDCRLGILATSRIAFAENGVNSYRRDKELLALIAPGWWYGYIRRVDPSFLASDRGEWAAALVRSTVHVDGETPHEVFRRLHRAWEEYLQYEPYYVQEPDDGMALCASFEEATEALRRIVERFAVCKRWSCKMGPDGLWEPPEQSTLDMRCMDLFGLDRLTDEEAFEKYELPLIEAARRETGLPPLSEDRQS